MRKEHKYLREWLIYHRHAGFTDFYLYDNNGDLPDVRQATLDAVPDDMKDCVRIVHWDDYDEANVYFNLFQVVKMPGTKTPSFAYNRQHLALADGLTQAKKDGVDVLFKFDMDEFVCPEDVSGTLKNCAQTLAEWILQHGHRGARLRSYFFSGNGHLQNPQVPQPLAYTKREAEPQNYKDACVVSKTWHTAASAHHWGYPPRVSGIVLAACISAALLGFGWPQTRSVFLRMFLLLCVVVICGVIAVSDTHVPDQPHVRLHHYVCRSLEEFIERRDLDMRLSEPQTAEQLEKEWKAMQKPLSEVEDTRCAQWWAEVALGA